ncbi:MAG: AtpZ/AtpI family protein [Candidatus Paceibacterota bacterium]|jgi:F0F1-type ATP synthase assembly protein I
MEEKTDTDKKDENKKSALALGLELGYTIAVPIIVFALLGRFLDKSLGTSPFLLLAGILISIFLSSYIIYKKVSKIIE